MEARPKHAEANHNYGLLLLSKAKYKPAHLLLKTALETNPPVSQFWSSYFDASILIEAFSKVEKVIKREGSQNKAPHQIIDVVTGSLCLFPASLLHDTIPFESEENRIVLAFDVQPRR